MRTYRYLHLDVFTDTALEGNQLAVFPEPAGLSTEEMQRITREMNFSECTFIFPPETAGTHVRMRIFTPGEELPMAGHPTIGSTFALGAEGVIAPGQRDFVFGLGVGPTPVSIEWRGRTLDFAWMTQRNPEFRGAIGDREGFARALGIAANDLASVPPEVVSCGVPFLFAPLTSCEAVDRVAIDRAAYGACCIAAGFAEVPLFIFTTENFRLKAEATGGAEATGTTSGGAEDVYSRMLAPGLGVSEDPATGGASGPLGCFLFKHRLLPRERLSHIVSLQGVRMLRPSRIHVAIDSTGEQITRVRVGGRSVLVGDGRLTF